MTCNCEAQKKFERINLCMSGGRTSAYMVEKVLQLQASGYFRGVEFVITFANTGREHPKTLEFVNNCNKRWQGLYKNNVVWLEAVVHEGRSPCSHKVVDFDSASKNGEAFENMVKKYGLPNNTFMHCTRELKENPILSYMESLGETKGHITDGELVPATYETWIGIRADEPRRLNGKKQGKQNKVYPLADGIYFEPVDKSDVLDFWEDMPFDLGIPEHLGNCIDCHKKSFKKLNMVYKDLGAEAFEFTSRLDCKYSDVKAQILDGKTILRKRFRGYKNTNELIESFALGAYNTKDYSEESGGCTESCEPFISDCD